MLFLIYTTSKSHVLSNNITVIFSVHIILFKNADEINSHDKLIVVYSMIGICKHASKNDRCIMI